MVDVCCDSAIEASLVIENNLSVPKSVKLFGGSIEQSSVTDNEYTFGLTNPAFSIAPNANGSFLFDEVSGYLFIGGLSYISVIDTHNNNAVINTIFAGTNFNAKWLTLVSSTRTLYVTCSDAPSFIDPNLIIINADTGNEISRKIIGYTPNQSVYSPTTKCLYVACRFGAQLSIYNTITAAVTNVPLPSGSVSTHYICYDPIHEYVYISNGESFGTGAVDVYDIINNVIVTSISTGDRPEQVLYQNGFVYIATQEDSNVGKINTSTNINTPVPGFLAPQSLYYSSVTNKVYVCGFIDAFLGVINAATGNAETPIDTGGLVANSILYNPVNSYFYVYNEGTGTYLVYTTDFELVNTALSPAMDAVSAITGSLYGPATASGNVAILSTSIGVTITGNGNVSLDQMNSDFTANPICLCQLQIVSTLKSAFNVPLSKNETLSTGSVLNTKLSLLAHYTVADQQNVVVLEKEDLKTCIIDGENYLGWEIPANCVISIVFKYCQATRMNAIGQELKDVQRPKKKRYMHGAFKFNIN